MRAILHSMLPTSPSVVSINGPKPSQLAGERGWQLMEDPKRGLRRVVASPAPQRIVQLATIEQLSDLGITVICCGGGGIPVSRSEDGQIIGQEAVIDKDRVSMLLAVRLGAQRLVITTSVDHVYEDFYSDAPRARPVLSADEVRSLHADGHFAAGSMAPKMEAAVDFLDAIDGEVDHLSAGGSRRGDRRAGRHPHHPVPT